MFEHFYYEAIRKTVIAFGTLFNNIYIKHKNDEGKVVSTQKVPFAYGPTQKFLARLEQSPDLSKPIQITTPRMSMEIVGLSYDSQRKGNTMRGFTAKDEQDKPRKSYLPVPYNVNFELSIFTKFMSHYCYSCSGYYFVRKEIDKVNMVEFDNLSKICNKQLKHLQINCQCIYYAQ